MYNYITVMVTDAWRTTPPQGSRVLATSGMGCRRSSSSTATRARWETNGNLARRRLMSECFRFIRARKLKARMMSGCFDLTLQRRAVRRITSLKR